MIYTHGDPKMSPQWHDFWLLTSLVMAHPLLHNTHTRNWTYQSLFHPKDSYSLILIEMFVFCISTL